MRSLCFLLLVLIPTTFFSQETNYAVANIPAELKENANAVVRLSHLDVTIVSQRSMLIIEKKVVTILNEHGVDDIVAFEYYDKSRKIKKIEAKILDSFGKELKTIKKKDFKDRSVGDGFSVFNDNRMLYLDYTPINYPFTVIFESEIETSNTAFLPIWLAFEDYYVSTQNKILNITYPVDLGFHKKESNFSEKYAIQKKESDGKLTYTVNNIHAMKGEESSPDISKVVPMVYMKLERFNLEGVDGQARTWEEFGKWYYESILKGTDQLSVETQNKIKAIVGKENNPIEIAKIVYNYVQERTRYVSIQVGIGGFKPMNANDVDRLGYGDCKALTNYTKALLNVVGVQSYYTIVNAGPSRRDIQHDFVSVQGNHVILAIPNKEELIWLECTSQVQPFGFQGTFTDDRNVLLIKPEGGQIVKTKAFLERVNSQTTTGSYSISDIGDLTGSLSMLSKGSQYDYSFTNERLSKADTDLHYKKHFSNINNLKLQKTSFKNDKKDIQFTEDIELSAVGYASISANRMLFVLNAFNINSNTPKRYRNRENPFQINRGFYDSDEVKIILPEGYNIEAIPQDAEIKNKYGEYKTQIIKENENTLIYKRFLLIKDGFYESKEYDEYRLFREQIVKNDNAKIVLNKKI
ncbi:hypothetical protein J2X31_000330 [Flavobacterium arsenatis]|uniref:DUF3857 domain-containing protein n=1 Tax=Flavobacterium arsenatis TaxID=1484332 RepID=A0ABU1TLN1_9FLAO|nr:DUF3857 domain-containing transglutaminase family protein [Flavobacterium arsenatis]MDR6966337.1 hypothetical protein [Flavobacterium arsenatis]